MHKNSASSSHTFAKRTFHVRIKDGDRTLSITRGGKHAPEYVDNFAVMKAAMRDAFAVCNDTELVLDNCVAGIPEPVVRLWMKRRLKKAA